MLLRRPGPIKPAIGRNGNMVKSDIKGLPTADVMQTWYAKELYRVAK